MRMLRTYLLILCSAACRAVDYLCFIASHIPLLLFISAALAVIKVLAC